MNGDVAIVTGASGAIGRAIATRVAERGYSVVLSGRDEARLGAAAAAARAKGARTAVAAGDLREPEAAERLVAEAQGLGRLGAVIHAAGDFTYGPLGADTAAASRALLDVHLLAATTLLAAAAEALSPGATVILVGSLAARRPFPNNAAYVAAKHGLAGLAGAVFAEQRARAVRVSCSPRASSPPAPPCRWAPTSRSSRPSSPPTTSRKPPTTSCSSLRTPVSPSSSCALCGRRASTEDPGCHSTAAARTLRTRPGSR